MGIPIHYDLQAVVLLYSLGPSFDNFRMAIVARDNLPTPDQLKIKILEEAEARSKGNTTTSPEEAFQTNHKGKGDKPRFKNRSTYHSKQNCAKCGRNNHTTEKCYAKTKINNKESTYLAEEICLSSGNRSPTDSLTLCLDSGSTSHVCKNRDVFDSITKLSNNNSLQLASNGQSVQILGKGLAKISHADRMLNLPDTLLVPNLTTNLLSVSKITSKGFKVTFDKNEAHVYNSQNEVVTRAKMSNGLYYVDTSAPKEKSNLICNSNIQEWHAKLGHINENDLKLAMKNKILNGLKFNSNEKLGDCEICIQSKMTRKPFPASGYGICIFLINASSVDVLRRGPV
uniref:Copia protein n=1 Tax=Lygus hesperus TaxID=30085 RepID=A0A146L6T4_LYGHE